MKEILYLLLCNFLNEERIEACYGLNFSFTHHYADAPWIGY